jgi:1-deoxyxylulose-5-phosphate synthase
MSMNYGNVEGIEKPISRLVQGTVMITTGSQDESSELLDAIYEQGCNAFDGAHVYGNGDCERAFGAWVNSRGIRDKVVILDKGAHHSGDRNRVTPFDIAADLHDSLARLKTDYIDLYVLHRDDPDYPVGPIVEALNEHKEAGRIHAFGGSNWSHQRIAEANAYAAEHGLTPFAVSSPNFSLAEQLDEPWDDCLTISGPNKAAAREWYAKEQFPLFTWSSLAQGFLSGRVTRENIADYPEEMVTRCYNSKENLERLDRANALAAERGVTVTQIAVAYVMNQPLNIYALVGCYTPKEMADNIAALQIELSDGDLAWLDLRKDAR